MLVMYYSRMMWCAGVLAAASSITYPAISAYASQNADSEQQGMLAAPLTHNILSSIIYLPVLVCIVLILCMNFY